MRLFGEYINDPERFLDLNSDSFREVVASPTEFVDVAVREGKIAGFITYTLRKKVKYPQPVVEIDDLFVSAEYRKKGLGRGLMHHLIEFATTANAKYIYIPIKDTQTKAVAFLKAMNFHEYGAHYRRPVTKS
ncbi:MAG: GNAT family N-acetyltransferase [Candidatus Dojkabacteria bacterium]